MNKLIQHLFYWFFLFSFTSTSFAAEVPEGAKLAKNQQITFYSTYLMVLTAQLSDIQFEKKRSTFQSFNSNQKLRFR